MNEKRSLGLAVKRGFLCRCPNCGEGKLFGKFLKVVDECAVCHEEFRHHRADDAPAYLVILIVGHIIVPSALWMEQLFHPPYWLAFSIWLPLTLILSLTLLQPMKGVIVGWQWAQRMHGFDPNHQDEIELMKDAR
ncbi:MAG: DUF983 domain-containing protein [Xanthobacteraceae bacterium]|nr:DUF983 domain-containing protein [Xanthobacteraceae bacterium]